jgi:hypothetical protein
MIDTFDEELKKLIEQMLPFEELQAKVAELHKKHGRIVPPPIIGTIEITEPKDSFGGK